jgi:acyl-homoserine-lactone acylase
LLPEPIASNGWAVGPDLTESGKGSLLVANPHFPWEGELRFWESHLTVPGEFDIYGVQLTGLPGIGIGFTESFGWTHTVSAGNRFTAYTLTLAPGDPTTYLVDGEPRAMTSQDITIAVLEDDGSVSQVTRTLWSSEYGPIIDFPGLGWSDTLVISYRDANLENDEFIEQYAAMNAATSLDEFIEAHRTYQGVPLFNTIAAGADGRVWYADTSATPNLTAEAEQLFRERLATDPITQLARSNGVILLDGSDSRFAWEEQDGARDPGLVPWEEMPMVERTDYVFNANDSFWLNNDGELLVGDYSLLHGEQGTQRSERTRQNVHMLENRSATQPAGADGRFSGEELRDATLANEAYTAVQFLDGVVERCDGAGEVNGVDLREACSVLAGWDGIYDLDRAGPILWREWLSALPGGIADLWATPFDPGDPANTPSGLAPAPAGEPDPVLVALAEAVNVLRSQGHGPDVVLGDLQYTERGSERIPIHGGTQREGLTNMVYWGGLGSSTEPTPERGDGYPISYGTSFLLTVDFSGDEVQAWAFLVYSNTEDRSSPLFDAQMRRFSEKDWRTLRLTDAAIEADPDLTVLEVIGD